MSVNDPTDIGPSGIRAQVERILRGRRMQSLARSILPDTDDILPAQAALVHARGGNPLVTIFIIDGNISPGGGCHVATVNTLHGFHDLVTRMEKRKVHEWLLCCQG